MPVRPMPEELIHTNEKRTMAKSLTPSAEPFDLTPYVPSSWLLSFPYKPSGRVPSVLWRVEKKPYGIGYHVVEGLVLELSGNRAVLEKAGNSYAIADRSTVWYATVAESIALIAEEMKQRHATELQELLSLMPKS